MVSLELGRVKFSVFRGGVGGFRGRKLGFFNYYFRVELDSFARLVDCSS